MAVSENGKYMCSVKLGPKGQIVIPKEVREIFGISPGDMMILLADKDRGIALHRADYFNDVANEIFRRHNQTQTDDKKETK